MTPPIERVRYYDGEYLRAEDFQTEQAYHIDMRRRLNMGLHLFGIVEGLQLGPILTTYPPAGPTTATISAGMAIDSFGREILLLSPYTFNDPSDLDANGITGGQGLYEVYLQYQTASVTPPSNGYADCNQTGEWTRTQESCKVVLIPALSNPKKVTAPDITADISEDPDMDTSPGVYLGLIYVSPGATTGTFSVRSQPDPNKIVYVGLRAQRIEPPDFDQAQASWSPLGGNDATQPPLGVEVLSNLFVDQNLVVGTNFEVTPQPAQPTTTLTPSPPTFPSPTGNLSVAADMFLQGNLYLCSPAYATPTSTPVAQWLELTAFIQAQIQGPDVQMGTITVNQGTAAATVNVTPYGSATAPAVTLVSPNSIASGGCNFTITSKRSQSSNVSMIASISSVTTVSAALLAAFGTSAAPAISVTPVAVMTADKTGASCAVTWSTGPFNTMASPPTYAGVTIIFSYVLVFTA